MSQPSAVLFDLDGTLIDSVPDIAASLNVCLAEASLAPLPAGRVAEMIGRGVERLLEAAFAEQGVILSERDALAWAERYAAIYETRAARETFVMPGAANLLRRLEALGVPLAVCTNKPERVTRTILSAFSLDRFFRVVIGGDALPKKPDPAMIASALSRLGVARTRDAVLIGDNGVDVAAARAAGISVVLVETGYTAVPPQHLGADDVFPGLDDPHLIESLRLREVVGSV